MSYEHISKIRVRYGETDQMGFVYYGVYAQYYEVGRVEALRALGVLYADMEKKHNIWLPVMNMQCRYLRPGRYDDLLSVSTVITEMPQMDIKFRYEIHNEKKELLNSASVRLCFLDAMTRQRIEAPAFITAPLKPYF